MNIFQGLSHIVPSHVPASGRTPVIFAGVNMFQAGAGRADGVAQRFLLDVHVERIKHDLAGEVIDAVNYFDGLRSQIDETGFKAIQRFDA